MARKSGRVKSARVPPPSPFRTSPYNKPYSLGDIEYRAEMQKFLKDDFVSRLAMRRIEQLTGGDYGQVLKYILPRKKGVEKSDSEKRLDKLLRDAIGARSASGTNVRGLYVPTESALRDYSGVRSKDPTLPEIFVQRPNVFDQEIIDTNEGKFAQNIYADDVEKEALKVGKDFKPGYFESFLEKLGIKDVDRSLKRRIEEGTMPTEEDIKEAKETMPFEKTARHELGHFGLDLLRALGYKLPERVKDLQGEERYMHLLDRNLKMPGYKYNPPNLTKHGKSLISQIDAMAKDALTKERGYKQGGLVAMLKSFK
jgi:hypothetical protein|tara:strand:- start:2507 stop:3442 length:936 start_codon:yes stop_codon:yes gene_type:complete